MLRPYSLLSTKNESPSHHSSDAPSSLSGAECSTIFHIIASTLWLFAVVWEEWKITTVRGFVILQCRVIILSDGEALFSVIKKEWVTVSPFFQNISPHCLNSMTFYSCGWRMENPNSERFCDSAMQSCNSEWQWGSILCYQQRMSHRLTIFLMCLLLCLVQNVLEYIMTLPQLYSFLQLCEKNGKS